MTQRTELYDALVSSWPREYDIRLILPGSSTASWTGDKRLFKYSETGSKDRYTMTPIFGDGDPFVVSKHYIESRTVVLPATMLSRFNSEMDDLLAFKDSQFWKQYIKNPTKAVAQFGVELNYGAQPILKAKNYTQDLSINPCSEIPLNSKKFWGCNDLTTTHVKTEQQISQAHWDDLTKRAKEAEKRLGLGGKRRSAQVPHYKGENKVQYAVDKVKNEAVDAAKTAAKITAGRTVNGLAADKLSKFLPEQYQPFADTPIGAMVIANLVSAIANIYAESNQSDISNKLTSVTEAMVLSATVDFVGAFDIDLLVREFLSSSEIAAVINEV